MGRLLFALHVQAPYLAINRRPSGNKLVILSSTIRDEQHIYRMKTLHEYWKPIGQLEQRLRLLEAYYDLPKSEYNRLFEEQLDALIARLEKPADRRLLELLRGFDWTGYIASAVYNAGFRDRRENQERTHDVAAKLLLGALFRGYDPDQHGPLTRRFRRSVGNAIRNIVEKRNTRSRLLPSVSGCVSPEDVAAKAAEQDDLLEDFRTLLLNRLGGLGLAVFNHRVEGGETKELIGNPDLGSPTQHAIRRIVRQIKHLAREFAARQNDATFVDAVERAMKDEAATVQKRASTHPRKAVRRSQIA